MLSDEVTQTLLSQMDIEMCSYERQIDHKTKNYTPSRSHMIFRFEYK